MQGVVENGLARFGIGQRLKQGHDGAPFAKKGSRVARAPKQQQGFGEVAGGVRGVRCLVFEAGGQGQCAHQGAQKRALRRGAAKCAREFPGLPDPALDGQQTQARAGDGLHLAPSLRPKIDARLVGLGQLCGTPRTFGLVRVGVEQQRRDAQGAQQPHEGRAIGGECELARAFDGGHGLGVRMAATTKYTRTA